MITMTFAFVIDWSYAAEISKTQQMGTLDGLYLNQFLQKTRGSYFLFGPKVDKFVTQLYRNGVDLRFYAGQPDSSSLPVGDQSTEYAEKQKSLLMWFNDQFEVGRKLFAKHLSIR
jgi:hypothetical protein